LEWLSDIDRADKLIVDLVIYLFSIAAFAAMPAHFGRKVWILVGWFLVLNVAFLMDFVDALDWQGPALFILLGQVPWFLFVLDLIFKGKLSGRVLNVPMREILAWQITRIMGIHFVLAIYGGYAPDEFALQVGFSEMVTGLGALALYIFYRPEKGWYRTLLIFWNTYGMVSVLSAEIKNFLSNPHIPFSHFSREIFQYMASYPQNWVYCFWFPIAIGMHTAVFYKMIKGRGATFS
jgi:hypothetical protein